MTTSFDEIEKIRLENGFVNLALIDPDTKNDSKLLVSSEYEKLIQ